VRSLSGSGGRVVGRVGRVVGRVGNGGLAAVTVSGKYDEY
jgi:hypothetical protein